MFYFAYGSNMLLERLRRRVPSARRIGTAALVGHRLAWRKRGRDGSAKCDIAETTESGALVWGILYEIDPAEKPALDKAESFGHGYDRKDVTVRCNGGDIEAYTYVALDIDESLAPYDWYKAFVLAGAKRNGLPQDHIRRIESVVSVVDPNRNRQKDNEEILGTSQRPIG